MSESLARMSYTFAIFGGGYVFTPFVCLSVCLFVSGILQKVMDGFSCNLGTRRNTDQRRVS